MQQWQMRKIDAAQAIEDLVRSRCSRAPSAIAIVETIRDKEIEIEQQKDVELLLDELEQSLGAFRSHPNVDKWLAGHSHQLRNVHFRSRCLLLRGESQAGKTRKATSLFGFRRTLIVNCQGLGSSLPSLRPYDRKRHLAICFDEITEQQVLANKMVFQCGPVPVQLSQSVCNQHSYTRWFYNCAMILCSNTFRVTQEDGLMEAADEDWLTANIHDARLPHGEKWFVDPRDIPTHSQSSCAFAGWSPRASDGTPACEALV